MATRVQLGQRITEPTKRSRTTDPRNQCDGMCRVPGGTKGTHPRQSDDDAHLLGEFGATGGSQ